MARSQSITMASTTSTEQSGLFAHLLPEFKKASGIDVKVVAVGTGQAIDMARRGDADVLFVHDQAAEERLVAEGGAVKRHAVMYNDFVLVGPKNDPAGVRGNDIRGHWRDSPPATPPSFRAATRAAPTRPNCVTGPRPGWATKKAPVTGSAAAAWGRRSTSQRPPAAMH